MGVNCASGPEWYVFQESICSHFNSIGASAQTNITLQGVRTAHAVDVVVRTRYLGEDLLWIIEAKKWKTRVTKLHVLALRTIADDVGADRAFIVSEAGFQSGAFDAAYNTNVKLKTYEELKADTRELTEREILKAYKKRVELLAVRYWAHSKSIRKKYGLRGELWDFPVNFSGFALLRTAISVIALAEIREYPIDLETHLVQKEGDLVASNFQQLANWLNLNLNLLDEKILNAEAKMIENGDFQPDIVIRNEGKFSPLKAIALAMKGEHNE